MEPIRPKVFLSYSRKDSELIRRLAQDLRRAQVDTWLDDFEILTGDMLREKIFGMGIPACDLFFAYLTHGSPIFKVVQKKWYPALYRARTKSPISPESAVGEGAERSHVARSGVAP